jgi:uncharacterized protein YoxC
MPELDLIMQIAQILLYLALVVMVVYIIIALKRITGAVDNINGAIDRIEKHVDELTVKAGPLIDNSVAISSDVKEVTETVKDQVVKIDGIVDSFKDTADSIIEFEQKVQREVETNVFDTLNMVAAISKGVKTFWSAMSSKNGSHRLRKSGIRSGSSESLEKGSEEDLY